MATSPPGLWKHPKTGVFWIRRRVPQSVVIKVGKRVVQETLRTKDRRTAEALFQVRMGEILATWATFEAQRQAPSTRAIAALAGEFCRSIISRHQEEPGQPETWRDEIERLTRRPPLSTRAVKPPAYGSQVTAEMIQFLDARGIDPRDRLPQCRSAFFDAKILALRSLERMAGGDYSEDPEMRRFPTLERTAPAPLAATPVRLSERWDEYANALSLAVATRKRWRPLIKSFTDYLGSDDLARATAADVESWVASLLAGRRSAQTVADAHLPALRSFLRWCVEEKHLSANVAADVRVRVPKEAISVPERPSFTRDEAALILSESLRPTEGSTSPWTRAARRWVPWLCAYTGARVNEMTQLRGQDVSLQDSGEGHVPCILITPDAGTVKGRQARFVPIHAHLIEQGFLDFARGRTGPLFYDARRPGTSENPAYRKTGERLGEWVRRIGVTRDVAPNHAWRHLFMTRARDVRMPEDVRERLVGHKQSSMNRGYGDAELLLLQAEVDRMSRFEAVPPGDSALPTRPRRRPRGRTVAAERATRVAKVARMSAAPRASAKKGSTPRSNDRSHPVRSQRKS